MIFDAIIFISAFVVCYLLITWLYQFKIIKIEDLPYGKEMPMIYCAACLSLLIVPIFLRYQFNLNPLLMSIVLGMGVYALLNEIIKYFRHLAIAEGKPTEFIKEFIILGALVAFSISLIFIGN